MSARGACGLLAASTAVALWLGAGVYGLLYAVLFAAACAPGIPLGIALFGSHHPAAWIGGALIGYGITQLALWAVIALGIAGPATFVLGWAFVTAGVFAVSRSIASPPLVPAPAWRTVDVRALLLVTLLAPVLMGITYRNLGKEDDQGNRYYRAYFTADFLWHTALAQELGKFTLPPRNPYLAPRPMNYYWTYFLTPASAARVAPLGQTHAVQLYLKSNAILVGTLMIAALFALVRTGTQSSASAAMAVVLAVLAASAEGLYASLDLLSHGRPLSALRIVNVDAISNWSFGGLRIDNVPRSLWYTPQHTTSLSLGLVGLTIGVLAGVRARPAAMAIAGLSLGLSTTMNPLLGVVCAAIYGACMVADALATRAGIAAVVRHALAAVFVVAAVGWGAVSRVTDGAASALDIGYSGLSRHSPVLTLLLSLGPVLVPALPGILRVRTDDERRAVVVGATGIVLGLFLLYFVRISEASWVGFRAGQILLVSIPVLLARTFDRLSRLPRAALAVVILALGLPTTIIDTYNAQDIGNRRPGPGFRWTLWTTPDQEQAFTWIRANTPEDAIVQMEPTVRGREHWTLIPSFAGRRMAAGLPISLLPVPEYQERSNQVRTLFATTNTNEAVSIGHRLRIDYLYVDGEDVRAYPEGTRKFDEHPESFERVFAAGDVRLYRLR